MQPKLKEIWTYPIKGCKGVTTDTAELDVYGLQGDRRYLIVDGAGRFLTQRSHPALTQVRVHATATGLQIEIPSHSFAVTQPGPEAREQLVTVWKDEGLRAKDCGDEAAAAFTNLLGGEARLVYSGFGYERRVKPEKAPAGDQVGFADAYPLLVIGTASLRDLNDRLIEAGEEPLPMNRFRPNLVVETEIPFEEDSWGRFEIGGIFFRNAGPCSRCVVTTTDQETGERGREPLRTLASYRRDARKPSDVNFGQNVIHETKAGRLRVGMAVTPQGA